MQFVYLRTCVPLYLVCGSNFLQLGSTFCPNAQKKRAKVNREKFLQRCNPHFFYVNQFNLIAGMSIIPSPCSFLYAFHLQWSLNISTDKKSNAVCTFANLCSTLFSLWFKFSSAWFYFLSKCTKKEGKS